MKSPSVEISSRLDFLFRMRMIRWSKYFLFAFVIYFLTIVLNLLIYFFITLLEQHLPNLTLWISTIGETILDLLNSFLQPFRYFLPNLSDEEYYLLLVNSIVMTFALAYAYLFCKNENWIEKRARDWIV